MNAIDVAILIVLAVFIFNGVRRGFLREIAGLIGIVVAFVLAVRLMNDFSSVVAYYLGVSPQVAVVITAAGIFILVLLAFILAAKLLRKLMDLVTLGWVDRLLGGVFGLLKGCLVVSILALIITLVPAGNAFKQEQNRSWLFQPIRSFAPMLFNGFIRIAPAAGDFYSELKQSLVDKSGELSGDALQWLQGFQKQREKATSDEEHLLPQ